MDALFAPHRQFGGIIPTAVVAVANHDTTEIFPHIRACVTNGGKVPTGSSTDSQTIRLKPRKA